MEKVIFIQILDRPLLNCPTLEEAPTSWNLCHTSLPCSFLALSFRKPIYLFDLTVGLTSLYQQIIITPQETRSSQQALFRGINGSSLVTACSLHGAHYLRMLSRTLGCPIGTRIPKELVHCTRLHSEDFVVSRQAVEHAVTDTGN